MKTKSLLNLGLTKLLAKLEKTPSGRSAGPAGKAQFTPPQAVQRSAEKGLMLRIYNEDTRGLSRPGGTDIGVARAVQLALGTPIPPRSVKRMKAYFDRHQKDKNAAGWKDNKAPSPGWVAWLLWGGDPGYSWAKKIVKEYNL